MPIPPFPVITYLNNTLANFRTKIKTPKVFVGQPETVHLLLTAVLYEGHALLEDIPGTEKTIDGSNLKITLPDILQSEEVRLYKRRRWLAAAHIRRIYAQLMELCDKLGKARPAAATPLEFLQTLEMLFPGENTQLVLITQAYLKVR